MNQPATCQKVSLSRRIVLMSILGPTTELLSFVPPKESTQRKGGPDAVYSLRSSLSPGVDERGFLPLRQRDASLHRPCGQIPSKALVLGAAYGTNPNRCSSFIG
ncbi:hypothetical protein [Methylomonas methanica]|uniref:hypothetical protein n=1 Tax=Methylomonas methanica TaxID=421 RepID=UPI0012F6F8EC|nr:hypothetical protein [Methylomonas methanica]